jgi:hypothetical protein
VAIVIQNGAKSEQRWLVESQSGRDFRSRILSPAEPGFHAYSGGYQRIPSEGLQNDFRKRLPLSSPGHLSRSVNNPLGSPAGAAKGI